APRRRCRGSRGGVGPTRRELDPRAGASGARGQGEGGVGGPLPGWREVNRLLVFVHRLLEVPAPEVGLPDPELHARRERMPRVLVGDLLEVQDRLAKLPRAEALHPAVEQLLGGDRRTLAAAGREATPGKALPAPTAGLKPGDLLGEARDGPLQPRDPLAQ